MSNKLNWIHSKSYKASAAGASWKGYSPWNSGIPEATQSLSLKAPCKSCGIKGVRHKGHVVWSNPIQRSRQPRWNTCLQFASRLISSFSPNSLRHTAQLSGGSTSSPNITTGRVSRIRSADTGSNSGIRVGLICPGMSGSRKSWRPR